MYLKCDLTMLDYSFLVTTKFQFFAIEIKFIHFFKQQTFFFSYCFCFLIWTIQLASVNYRNHTSLINHCKICQNNIATAAPALCEIGKISQVKAQLVKLVLCLVIKGIERKLPASESSSDLRNEMALLAKLADTLSQVVEQEISYSSLMLCCNI